MISFAKLSANLGIFIWPLTGVLGVALWHMASYAWAQLAGRGGESQTLDTITQCGTLAQLVGMLGTIAGLVEGLAQIDPGNVASLGHLVSCMALAFWTTYFGLGTALIARAFIMYAPYMKPLSASKKIITAAGE